MSEVTHDDRNPDPSDPESHVAQGVQMGKVILVGVIAIVTFVIGSIWSLQIYYSTRAQMNPTGRASVPSELGQEEIGIVDQVPFELNHWVPDYKLAQRQKLETYGWVDRKAGTIHIPIDRAIELTVAERAK